MRPMIISGFTNILKGPKDWDAAKHGPIVDLHIRQMVREGLNCMQSVWLPSPNDLALLNAGCPVILEVLGHIQRTGHPPVLVMVGAVADLQIMNDNKGGKA